VLYVIGAGLIIMSEVGLQTPGPVREVAIGLILAYLQRCKELRRLTGVLAGEEWTRGGRGHRWSR
jgi:hypothetical protein